MRSATGRASAWRLLELAPEAPGYLRRLETPLVGRVDELEQLAVLRAGRGASGRQALHAPRPAGIGKTRLARARPVRRRSGHGASGPLSFLRRGDHVLAASRDRRAGRRPVGGAGRRGGRRRDRRPDGAVGLSGQETTNEETSGRLASSSRRWLDNVRSSSSWRTRTGRAGDPGPRRAHRRVVERGTDRPLCLGRSELVDERPRLAGGRANVASVVLEPLSSRRPTS